MINKNLNNFNTNNKLNDNKLKNYINKNNNNLFEILKKFDINNFNLFLNNLKIKEYYKNKVLFYQNSTANSVYIILKGTIDIYQYKNKITNLQIKFNYNKKEIINYNKDKYGINFYDNFKKDKKLYSTINKNFKIIKIATLNTGEIFGELALIENTYRNATAIINIKEENLKYNNENKIFSRIKRYSNKIKEFNKNNNNMVVLAKLKKDDFDKLFNKIKHIFDNNVNFSFFNDFFINYPFKKDLKNIIYFFKESKFKEREIIVKSNSKIKYLYIICQGSVSINDTFNPYINSKKQDNINNTNYFKILKWNISLRIISKNSIIGLTEALNNQNYYNYTYKAINPCICYKIKYNVI